MEAYKRFSNGEQDEPDAPWGPKLAKDYPRIEAHEIDMAHLRNIHPPRPVRQQNQSDSSTRQSAGPKNPSPQTSNSPITCVKCGLYQIHTEPSVSQGKYCCNTCFKTEGRQHGPKCVKEPATPAVPTPPVVQRQDRPTEEAAKPIADSTDPKRADTGADAAALAKSTASSAAQGPKTEEDKKVKEPKRTREADKPSSSKRQKLDEDQDKEPQDDKVRPKRGKQTKKKQEPAEAEETSASASAAVEVGEASPKKKRKKVSRKAKQLPEGAAQQTT